MTSPWEAPPTEEQPRRTLRVGARVEVRNRFDGSWSAGFEVSAERPAHSAPDDVRREPRTSMWWV
jgi:hypothetical protein